MDNQYYTTEHKKGQHLTSEERHEIEVRLKDKWSPYKISKHLRRPYNTIKNEIKRGTVVLYNGKVQRYRADEGEKKYLENRENSRRQYRVLETSDFLRYVIDKFQNKGWSPDACVGEAIKSGKYTRNEIVCTKTLYNYIDLGLLPIKNIHLPEKTKRNAKSAKIHERKRNLGRSIDERPEEISLREEFGHWEIDSVIGSKDRGEPVVMTMLERKTRDSLFIKAEDHTAEAINAALDHVFSDFREHTFEVFKTITADNGSEFAELSRLENGQLKVYFTHPYSSFERGTNERHNRMLRRFIPKGKSIADYSADDIAFFADRINALPRKILGYATPEELFEKELDLIYSL